MAPYSPSQNVIAERMLHTLVRASADYAHGHEPPRIPMGGDNCTRSLPTKLFIHSSRQKAQHPTKNGMGNNQTSPIYASLEHPFGSSCMTRRYHGKHCPSCSAACSSILTTGLNQSCTTTQKCKRYSLRATLVSQTRPPPEHHQRRSKYFPTLCMKGSRGQARRMPETPKGIRGARKAMQRDTETRRVRANQTESPQAHELT